jgi:hypothetical protein
MMAEERFSLVFISGNLNIARYIAEVLYGLLQCPIFQQDNSPSFGKGHHNIPTTR